MSSRKSILCLGPEISAQSLGRFQKMTHFLKSAPLASLKADSLKSEPSLVIASDAIDINELEAVKKKWPKSNWPLILIVYDQKNTKKIVALMNVSEKTAFLIEEGKTQKLASLLETIFKQKKKNEAQKQLPLADPVENLDDESVDLAQMIQKPSTSIESKVSKVRGLIRFLKELSTIQTIEELLTLMRHEAASFQHVQPPILYSATLQKKIRVHFFQGTKVLHKKSDELAPQTSQASVYLANLLERPFAKILAVPLRLRQPSTTATLYFEHAMSDLQVQAFVEFINARLEPVSTALDRIFLESDLKDASLVWERTFDGIQDPIAIFDSEEQLLRANRAFSEKLRGLKSEQLSEDKIIFQHRVFETKSYPIHPLQGGPATNIVNHYMDVTLSHRLQQQMIQNEKMAALGHLAGNIAHELNNPLTGIRSLAQILVQQVEKETNQYKDLVEVERAAERCQSIIRILLDFSTGGVKNKTVVSLNDVVQKTLPLLKTAMGRFQQEIELSENELMVLVEPQLLQQVVFNLVKNACQALGEKGLIRIETRMLEGQAQLIVSDTGSGIPPEIKSQIFDFFFTTKNPGQGTGLGLSMSKSIIDEFGGQISVESELGEGSQFKVVLPLAKEM
jgi:two-component system, NtrC family, sensor kinase